MLPMTLRKPVEDFDGGLDQIAQLSQFPSDVFWGEEGISCFPFVFQIFQFGFVFSPSRFTSWKCVKIESKFT